MRCFDHHCTTICTYFWTVRYCAVSLAQESEAVLELPIEIADICQIFNLVSIFFFKLSIKIDDFFILGNKK